MKIKIIRLKYEKEQTLGDLFVYDDSGKQIFTCKTLELEDDNNTKQKSCIPKGNYNVVKRHSAKFNDHFHILNVPNREYILIHAGNYHRDILGCVLVGSAYQHLDNDGYIDITNSKVTLNKLLALLPDSFKLTIE